MKKEQVEKAAKELIEESGLVNLTRDSLCTRAGIPDGSFVHVMGESYTDFVARQKSETRVHTVSKKRISSDDRKDALLRVAVGYSITHGYLTLTSPILAKEAGLSTSLVTHYFGTKKHLTRSVVRAAVASEALPVIAQALANKDANVSKITDDLKRLALESVM